MTTMLNKAAEAAHMSLANDGLVIEHMSNRTERVHIFAAEPPKGLVLAVLRAIREPSEGMVFAGSIEADTTSSEITDGWRAMLDTLIAEQEA